MAPGKDSKSGRGAAKLRNSDVEDASPMGSQSSGDDKVSKLAETMRRDIMVRRDKKRAEINQAFSESLRNIEAAMTLRFDEISKRMVIRHKLRLERLQELFRRRTAIEARMLASTRNIENAMIWAEKALDSSLKRRLQGLGGHANAPTA